MISEKSVQEIIETAKVEEVVQDYINLKRRGVNMIGLCPFHNEKTPSFTVSPSKNIYKCFGCGKGGNAVQFLMDHDSMSFPEALRHLANKFNIEIEETETSQEAIEQRQYLDSLFLINQYAKDFYKEQLFDTDKGKAIGLSYFKERGFREETIKKFNLGFAPPLKDSLTRTAVAAGYDVELLKKLGLSTQYGSDFFRDRVMFTIHNLSGKVLGFGGRTLHKDKKIPKYINSPETEIYVKNKVLYGAYFAKKAIRQEDECILVEGYTDVISLHQAGIENVVASSGTSLTEGQIQLIKRYTPNVKILYDGDLAGVKAALRGLDLVLEQDLNVKVVLLPNGEDPDSYLQKLGDTAFKEYLDSNAKDFIMFKADLLLKEAGNDPIKKSNLIKDIVSSIALIPDPVKRAIYIKECSKIVEVSEQILVNETNKLVGKRLHKIRNAKPSPQASSSSAAPTGGEFPSATDEPYFDTEEIPQEAPLQRQTGDEFQEKDIIRILISGGDKIFDEEENMTVAEYILSNIQDVVEDFDHELYQRVIKISMELLSEGQEVSPKVFLNHIDMDISQLAVNCISSPYEYSENWEKKWDIFLQTQRKPDENFQRDSLEALRRFKLRKIIGMTEKNKQQIKALADEGDMDQLMTHLKVQQRLIEIRNELADQLGTVVLK